MRKKYCCCCVYLTIFLSCGYEVWLCQELYSTIAGITEKWEVLVLPYLGYLCCSSNQGVLRCQGGCTLNLHLVVCLNLVLCFVVVCVAEWFSFSL